MLRKKAVQLIFSQPVIHPHLALGALRTFGVWRIFSCCAFCNYYLSHLIQHYITDGWEPLRLLYARRHELEAQQEVPVILTLPSCLRQI